MYRLDSAIEHSSLSTKFSEDYFNPLRWLAGAVCCPVPVPLSALLRLSTGCLTVPTNSSLPIWPPAHSCVVYGGYVMAAWQLKGGCIV